MKEGGVGGNSTATGLKFEKETDLANLLISYPGYTLFGSIIYYHDERVAEICKGHALYRFLKQRGIKWEEHISQQLLPDEAIFVYSTKTMIVIEKKYQQGAGSVDEKIQTCDFKKRQYKKLLKPLGINFKMIYVLNDWYRNPRYKDPLSYIKETGSDYYFNVIPLADLGLQL